MTLLPRELQIIARFLYKVWIGLNVKSNVWEVKLGLNPGNYYGFTTGIFVQHGSVGVSWGYSGNIQWQDGSNTFAYKLRPIVFVDLSVARLNLNGSGSSGNPYTLTAK